MRQRLHLSTTLDFNKNRLACLDVNKKQIEI